jgi:hypothetical protein
MRLAPLLMNVLMLLAIVLNTIPLHAHALERAGVPTHGTHAEAVVAASPADDAMPCHDAGAPASDAPTAPPSADDADAALPCCDESAGACECACLLQAAALASAVPRLPPSPPRAAPLGIQPPAAEPPVLASLIRPPIA